MSVPSALRFVVPMLMRYRYSTNRGAEVDKKTISNGQEGWKRESRRRRRRNRTERMIEAAMPMWRFLTAASFWEASNGDIQIGRAFEGLSTDLSFWLKRSPWYRVFELQRRLRVGELRSLRTRKLQLLDHRVSDASTWKVTSQPYPSQHAFSSNAKFAKSTTALSILAHTP